MTKSGFHDIFQLPMSISIGATKELAEGIVETFERAVLSDEPAKQGDVHRIERQLAVTENRLIMWVIGAQIAGTGLLLATTFFA